MKNILLILSTLCLFSELSVFAQPGPVEGQLLTNIPAENDVEITPTDAELACQSDEDCVVIDKGCCYMEKRIAVNSKIANMLKKKNVEACLKLKAEKAKMAKESGKPALEEAKKAAAEATKALSEARKSLAKASKAEKSAAQQAVAAAQKAAGEAKRAVIQASKTGRTKLNQGLCHGRRAVFSSQNLQPACIEQKCQIK